MAALSTFLSELKRRRVFRVAAVYGGVAFVLVQIIDGTFEVMGIPAWVSRLAILLLTLGFPLAVGLAWVFDITPEGIVRTGKAGGPAALRRAQGDEAGGQSQPGSGKPLTSNRALIAIAILAVAFGVWSWLREPEHAFADKSIAVLPFENLSGVVEDDYFSDGITEEIITQLARFSDLMVIGRTSVMQYKGTTKRLKDIGAELGVSVLLEGSVRRAGGKVRIVSQLIDPVTERHLWAESYDREVEAADIFALQSDVARRIVEALRANLSVNEKSLLEGTPRRVIPAAYDLYLKALQHDKVEESRENEAQVIAYLEQAVALDPTLTEAHASLATFQTLFHDYGYDPSPERLDLARQALDRARELAPGSATVLKAEGDFHYYAHRDYFKALEAYYASQRLEPGNPELQEQLAYVQRRLGRFDEGLANLLESFQRDPLDGNKARNIGWYHYYLRDIKQAETFLRQAIALTPTRSGLYRQLARMVYRQSGEVSAARAILTEGEARADSVVLLFPQAYYDLVEGNYAQALERYTSAPITSFEERPTSPPRSYYLGITYAEMGQAQRARAYFQEAAVTMQEAAEAYPDDPRGQGNLGQVYAYLGRRDAAVRAATRATEMLPVSRDALIGPFIVADLAEVYVLTGDHDRALDLLERLMAIPSSINSGALRHDLRWEPLHSHPRYVALLDKYGGGR